jgi:hypothetical protein
MPDVQNQNPAPPSPTVGFLQKYSAQTHMIAAGIVFAIGAYAEVPQFHAYVNSVAAHLPAWVTGGVSAAVAVYLHYRDGKA